MKRLTGLALRAYLGWRRVVPGPVRDDLLLTPWTKEYRGVPDSGDIGPAWARDIQSPTTTQLKEN